MPTHRTKACYIDALQLDEDSDLLGFAGSDKVLDASVLFPNETWTAGFKVVFIKGSWLTLAPGQWLIKIDDVLDRIINDTEFQEKYESV